MNDISRRNFMKGLAGAVVGVSALSKAEDKTKREPIDLNTVPNFITQKYDPKMANIDPDSEWAKENKKYDLIADLVEEMNNFDKKIPDTYISYSIHCNYTGLAFLNDMGQLERDDFANQVKYKFWIPYSHWQQRISFVRYMPIINVIVRPNLSSDLGLIAQYSTRRNILNKLENVWTLVTTRCFNVNRNEEGKKIAMGGWRPTPLQTKCQALCKEAIKSGQAVYFVQGVTKEGTPWVKSIKGSYIYSKKRAESLGYMVGDMWTDNG